MADLLVRFGAKHVDIPLDPRSSSPRLRFASIAQRLHALIAEHPEYLRRPRRCSPRCRTTSSTSRDCCSISASRRMSKTTTSIVRCTWPRTRTRCTSPSCSSHAAPRSIPLRSVYNNTPLGAANYCQHPQMIELLGRYSRDVWELTGAGNVDRLRELFREKPDLARTASGGHTPLMWLPTFSEDTRDRDRRAVHRAWRRPIRREQRRSTRPRTVPSELGCSARPRCCVRRHLRQHAAAGAVRRGRRCAARGLSHRNAGSDGAALEAHVAPARMAGHAHVCAARPRQAAGVGWRGRRHHARRCALLVAREHGFESWAALGRTWRRCRRNPERWRRSPLRRSSRAKPTTTIAQEARAIGTPRSHCMREQRIPALDAQEQMTDEVLARDRRPRACHDARVRAARSDSPMLDCAISRECRSSSISTSAAPRSPTPDSTCCAICRSSERSALRWTRMTDAGAAQLSHCRDLEHVDLAWTRNGRRRTSGARGQGRLPTQHRQRRHRCRNRAASRDTGLQDLARRRRIDGSPELRGGAELSFSARPVHRSRPRASSWGSMVSSG